MRILQTMLSWLRKSEKTKPVIRLKESGFSVIESDRVVLHIQGDDVREIVAYKADLFSYDEICVGFRTGEAEVYHSVTEASIHYKDLFDELPRKFPGIRTDWFNMVAFPAFAENRTTLWGESLQQPIAINTLLP